MKLQILSTLLLALTASAAANPDPSPEPADAFAIATNPRAACAKKNPRVVKAIDQFCASRGTKLVVPSLSAHTGILINAAPPQSPNNIYVWIEGTCSPAQWVPQEICYRQFYQICAAGGPKGGAVVSYGKEGCQKWNVLVKKP